MSTISISDLNRVHTEYQYYKDTWCTISDLKEGASALLRNVRKYCPQRPGEEPDIYRLRLAKFSYTPVMSSAIRQFTAKLSSTPVTLIGAENHSQFWDKFRANTDNGNGSRKRTEKMLIQELFSILLYYGRVFVVGDKPKLGKPVRSKLEEEKLAPTPYVRLFTPDQVLNWGEDWCIIKYPYTKAEPLKEPKHLYRWEVVTTTGIDVYEALATDVTVAKLVSSWQPELGRPAFTTLELPTELWTGNSVYLKQQQHTLIENGWTDAGSIAGIVQRIFTPSDPPPLDDTRYTFDQPDYSEVAKSGNAYTMIGKNYEFKESSGSAITSLTSQLETIEAQIKSLVDMTFASVPGGVQQASGVSKEVDMTLLNDTMEHYGILVLGLYQDILDMVADLAGVDRVSAYGLNSYSSNNLNQLIEQSVKLEGMPLPSTVLHMHFRKMSKMLAGSLTPEIEQDINTELEQMLADGVFTVYEKGLEASEDNVTKMSELFGIEPDEAAQLLGGS